MKSEQYYSAQMLLFSEFVLVGSYLQSGSHLSIGVSSALSKKYNYCRCRQLEELISLANKENDNIIMTGDFNFDLNGDPDVWTELNIIDELGLSDEWKGIYPNDKGFTEDEIVNVMRYNSKPSIPGILEKEPKQVRYDGMLIKRNFFGILQTKEMKILGKEKIGSVDCKLLIEELINRGFDVNIIREILKYDDDKKTRISLFPSDHFGVVASIEL